MFIQGVFFNWDPLKVLREGRWHTFSLFFFGTLPLKNGYLVLVYIYLYSFNKLGLSSIPRSSYSFSKFLSFFPGWIRGWCNCIIVMIGGLYSFQEGLLWQRSISAQLGYSATFCSETENFLSARLALHMCCRRVRCSAAALHCRQTIDWKIVIVFDEGKLSNKKKR